MIAEGVVVIVCGDMVLIEIPTSALHTTIAIIKYIYVYYKKRLNPVYRKRYNTIFFLKKLQNY